MCACIMPSLRIRAEYCVKYWSRIRDDKAFRRQHDRLQRHGCGVGPPLGEPSGLLTQTTSTTSTTDHVNHVPSSSAELRPHRPPDHVAMLIAAKKRRYDNRDHRHDDRSESSRTGQLHRHRSDFYPKISTLLIFIFNTIFITTFLHNVLVMIILQITFVHVYNLKYNIQLYLMQILDQSC